jgi:membrane protein
VCHAPVMDTTRTGPSTDVEPAWLRLPGWPRGLRHAVRVLVLGSMRWLDANGPQLGASIAFYTIFSLAPLLVITIAVVGAVFGEEAARGQIVGQIDGLVGSVAAQAIEALIANAGQRSGNAWAAAIGVGTLLIGATTVFAELQRALNAMGRIEPAPSVVGAFVRVRLIAIGLVLGAGFLAIASLMVSAALTAALAFLSSRYEALAVVARTLDFVVSVAVLGVAFAALLRWLPSRSPTRRSLWLAALVSAGLFAIGKTLIGLYLAKTSVASTYGAAGSFVVVLLWVYYSAQIFLFGAAIGRIDEELRAGPSEATAASAMPLSAAPPAPG